MPNADGSANSDYGLPTTLTRFDPKWIRKLIQIYTTIDPGANPFENMNEIFNKYGVQPVAFVTLKNQAIRAYNPGFARALAAGTAIEQNADSTFVQTGIQKMTDPTSLVNDDTTVYTVTTGKTFYCTGAFMCNNSGAAAVLFLYDGGTTYFAGTIVPTKQSTWLSSGQTPLFVATSGTAIKIKGAGATANLAGIVGWEE